MSAHTGPWEARVSFVTGETGFYVVRRGAPSASDLKQADADAALIAAAPDLLAALEQVVNAIDNDTGDADLGAARDAIAKARGSR